MDPKFVENDDRRVDRTKSGEVERALPPRDGTYLKNRFRGQLGLAVS